MGSLYILIPVVIVLVVVAVAIFLWAVNNHQFEDLDTEGQRLLFDREVNREEHNPGALGRHQGLDPETTEPAPVNGTAGRRQ